ncbi:hypothetical protein [Ruegeria arenilitoris]|uniref:hypothetical protein n=1 Tax=Ruegeria arenilitoris TaxID=1173585 RepID=UPI00147FCFB0|nr:hypothetical protein [Ruegeria arenilitoris]
MIDLLMGSGAVQWVLGVLAAVIGVFAYGKVQKRKGKREVLREVQEADYENAAEIYDRVERNLDKRVRDMESRGYRD